MSSMLASEVNETMETSRRPLHEVVQRAQRRIAQSKMDEAEQARGRKGGKQKPLMLGLVATALGVAAGLVVPWARQGRN